MNESQKRIQTRVATTRRRTLLPCILLSLSTLGLFYSAVAAEHPAPRIAVVRGNKSLPNHSERTYARLLTDRLAQWLNEAGIRSRIIDDTDLSAGSLSGVSVAVLSYNTSLDSGMRTALRTFLSTGGKLIVFYCGDPELATTMGFRLEHCRNSPTPLWQTMYFPDNEPHGVPDAVRQQSKHCWPAFPATASARIVARWKTEKGESLPDPAAVLSSAGFWISYILLNDGDSDAKKRLLLAMTAHLDPTVWPTAMTHLLNDAGKVGRFGDLSAAITGIRTLAAGSTAEQRVESMLTLANSLATQARQAADSASYANALDRIDQMKPLLAGAYGIALKLEPATVRAVWDPTGFGLFPGDWDRTCKTLAGAGITDLFVNFLKGGIAHTAIRSLPPSPATTTLGDQLPPCLQAAHRHGIRLHVWKICWNLDGAPDSFVAPLRTAGRLQVSEDGKPLNWLCPSNPDNRRLEKDALREVLAANKVDGLHLDYIRYPDSKACYCAGCKARFESLLGSPVPSWPASCRTAPLAARYNDWRCAQITALVRDAKAIVTRAGPNIRLSAAVYGKYPSCMTAVAQDWVNWIRAGDMDFVCPMNYTADNQKFQELVASQVTLTAQPGSIIPGIGVTAAECQLEPGQILDQIAICNRLRTGGFTLFALNRTLQTTVLPVLSASMATAGTP